MHLSGVNVCGVSVLSHCLCTGKLNCQCQGGQSVCCGNCAPSSSSSSLTPVFTSNFTVNKQMVFVTVSTSSSSSSSSSADHQLSWTSGAGRRTWLEAAADNLDCFNSLLSSCPGYLSSTPQSADLVLKAIERDHLSWVLGNCLFLSTTWSHVKRVLSYPLGGKQAY